LNIIIFDTETISLEKPFCYNVGYTILDTDTKTILEKRDFVISQIWNNQPLFSTAYYNEKKPLYVGKMRSRQADLRYWGYVMGQLRRDVKNYNVVYAYAYNSKFDDKVFDFNCDWHRTQNGLDNVRIIDLYGMAIQYIINQPDYQKWASDNKKVGTTGKPSATAESVYQYLTKNTDFVEEHTALADAIIETEILIECLNKGAKLGEDYAKSISINEENLNIQTLTIKINGEEVGSFDYRIRTNRLNTIYLKK
jgi:hypothetical protein